MRSLLAQQSKEAAWEQKDQACAMHAAKFSRAPVLMAKASEEVLAFCYFPLQHLRKVWSTTLVARVIEEIRAAPACVQPSSRSSARST